MIYQASFPQEIIQEDEDPIFEINECVTSQIKDMSKEIQDRVEAYTGSRLGQFRSFKLRNKEKKVIVNIDIEPMGAVRTTQRAKWKDPAAIRYGEYKKFIAWTLTKSCKTPTKQPVDVLICFTMPIPQSWSKKKRAASVGLYHTSKPDLDNLIKGCFDAANAILWQDDNQVVKCNAMKIYGEKAGINMQVTALYETISEVTG